MPQQSTFNFSQVSPHLWENELGKFSLGESLVTNLFWGAHETMKGTRDFSKTSRLRLEKFLSLCQAKGIALDIRVGFPAEEDIFPEWAMLTPRRSAIPDAVWDKSVNGYQIRSVPSIFEPELSTSFKDYLREVFHLLALYRHPEGPVKNILIDPGIYHFDWCIEPHETFATWLREKYQSIKDFNFLFQTAFQSFESATQAQGLRVLSEKRPWLMAREYKAFRSSRLSEWCKSLTPDDWKGSVFEAKTTLDRENSDIWIENSFFDISSNGSLIPLCPWKNYYATCAQAFRISEFLFQELENVSPLSQFKSNQSKVQLVIAGKYLVNEEATLLKQSAEDGALFLFPFGIPQYDERMTQLSWGAPKPSRIIKGQDRIYSLQAIGAGGIIHFQPSLQIADEWWMTLRACREEVTKLL